MAQFVQTCRKVLVLVFLTLATVSLGGSEGWVTVSAPPRTPAARTEVARVAGLSGSQPFVTILCSFADANTPLKSAAYFEGLFGGAYPGLDDYWREVSYGAIDLAGSRVAGWYALPETASAYRQPTGDVDLVRLAADCTAAADADVDYRSYVGINLVFSANLLWQVIGGSGCLDLDGTSRCYGLTWLWPVSFRDQALVAHEMGHAFGLPHSASVSGSQAMYDNPWDVMSDSGPCEPDDTYGPVAQHPIAYHKDRLGWIPASRKLVAARGSTSTVVLERLALPGSEGYLLAVVPLGDASGRFYTVEARRRAGYDTHLPGDAVVIHEVDPDRVEPAHLISSTEGAGLSTGTWKTGDVFIDPLHDIAISVDAITGSGFVITITVA